MPCTYTERRNKIYHPFRVEKKDGTGSESAELAEAVVVVKLGSFIAFRKGACFTGDGWRNSS